MRTSAIIPPGEVLPPLLSPEEQARRAKRQAPRVPERPQGPPPANRSQRFALLNAFVDQQLRDLTRAELVTWLVLYRDTRDDTARTAASDIARRGGLSRQAVQTALRELRRRGLLVQVKRDGLGRGLSIHRVCSGAEGRPAAAGRGDQDALP